VFRIGSCNCGEELETCKKEKIDKYPVFRVYPPQPIPPYDIEGSVDVKSIIKQASKFYHSNVIEVTSTNANAFLTDSPSVPKVLLFTDKKGLPLIYKGLSVNFEVILLYNPYTKNKLHFGITRQSDTILADRYNIRKFPTILVLKANEKKPVFYKGDIKFRDIFEFLNIYSGTKIENYDNRIRGIRTRRKLFSRERGQQIMAKRGSA